MINRQVIQRIAAAAIFLGLAVFTAKTDVKASASGYRICYLQLGGEPVCNDHDDAPPNLTVYNACELIAEESMIEILDGGSTVACGWPQSETAELTIEILD